MKVPRCAYRDREEWDGVALFISRGDNDNARGIDRGVNSRVGPKGMNISWWPVRLHEKSVFEDDQSLIKGGQLRAEFEATESLQAPRGCYARILTSGEIRIVSS